jgi:hypothetical protein
MEGCEVIQLRDCPTGLFWFNDTLGFKSEYKTQSKSSPEVWQCDAYVVASGEYFWGGISDARQREQLLVKPIDDETALAALRARPAYPGDGSTGGRGDG